jgi:hypothetical protein
MDSDLSGVICEFDPKAPAFEPVHDKMLTKIITSKTTRLQEDIAYNKNFKPELNAGSQYAKMETTKGRASNPVIDDPRDCGREVDAFQPWYAELQLAEFTKKYPLTGRKAGEITAEELAATKIVQQNPVQSLVQFRPYPQAYIREVNSQARRTQEMKENQNTTKEKSFQEACRRGGIRGNATIGVSGKVVTGPASRHAAVIQQRLEYLLLKEKERKVVVKN